MAPTSGAATPMQTEVKNDDKNHSSTPLLRASKSQIFALSPVVKLLIGPAQVEYHVHKEMLCSESHFFRACFTSGFVETTSGKVEMPEDSTKEVEHFVQWLYSGGPEYTQFNLASTAGATYAFATKIGAHAYCNAIMDAVIDLLKATNRNMNITGCRILHDAGLSGTPIGRFALKSAVYRLMSMESEDALNSLSEQVKHPALSQEIMADILLAVLDYRRSAWTNPATWEKSLFHMNDT